MKTPTDVSHHPALPARRDRRTLLRQLISLTLRLPMMVRGFVYGRSGFESSLTSEYTTVTAKYPESNGSGEVPNPLAAYFESRDQGRGIWKWNHYFDIYHRHLRKFQGTDATIVEIGIYSGGSLEMWRDYLGSQARIIGVDIEPACKQYEDEQTEVFIGDQADLNFWKGFKAQVESVDIVVDDGGHEPEQQIVTLEQLLPYLNPGGVYICEDIHGVPNHFAEYLSGLSYHLHWVTSHTHVTNSFQRWIRSISIYPYLAVVEKSDTPVDRLDAPKHGTEWQPFL